MQAVYPTRFAQALCGLECETSVQKLRAHIGAPPELWRKLCIVPVMVSVLAIRRSVMALVFGVVKSSDAMAFARIVASRHLVSRDSHNARA